MTTEISKGMKDVCTSSPCHVSRKPLQCIDITDADHAIEVTFQNHCNAYNMFSNATRPVFLSLVPTCPMNCKNRGFLRFPDTEILTTIVILRTAMQVHIYCKNRQRLGCLGQYLQSRNDSDSSDHIVKSLTVWDFWDEVFPLVVKIPDAGLS